MRKNKTNTKNDLTACYKRYQFAIWAIRVLLPMFFIAFLISDFLTDALYFPAFNETFIFCIIPVVITEIVVSLSMPNFEIYGQKISEFRRNRSYPHFGFIEINCTFLIIMIAVTLLFIFKRYFSIFVLTMITYVYCFIFTFQEISLLTKNTRYINFIVRLNYAKPNKESTEGRNSKTVGNYKIFQNIVINNGIIDAIDILTKQGKYSIDTQSLFACMNSYLYDLKKLITGTKMLNDGQKVIKSLEMITNNIQTSLLQPDYVFNASDNFDYSKLYYFVTSNTIHLQEVYEKMEKSEIFYDEYLNILNTIFWKFKEIEKNKTKRNFVFGYLETLLCYTLSHNQLWYVIVLRDMPRLCLYDNLTFNYYLYLTFMIFYFTTDLSDVESTFRDSLCTVLKGYSKAINSDEESLAHFVYQRLYYYSVEDIMALYPLMLDIYFSDDRFHYFLNCNEIIGSCTSNGNCFDENFLTDCWIQILTMHFETGFKHLESTKSFINSLDSKYSSILFNRLREKRFKNKIFSLEVNELEYSYARVFLNNKSTFYTNKDSMIYLIYDLLNNLEINDLNNKGKESLQLLEPDFEMQKLNLLHSVEKEMKKFCFYKSDSKTVKNLYKRSILFNSVDYNEEKDFFIKNISYSIGLMIGNRLDNQGISNIIIDSNLTMSKFADDGFLNTNGYYFTSRRDDRIKEVGVPFNKNYIWKDEAIAIDFFVDERQCKFRRLNSNEINQIIDRDYSISDGLYRYNEVKNSRRIVFTTRDELYNLIYNRYFVFDLCFCYSLTIKTDDIKEINYNFEKINQE